MAPARRRGARAGLRPSTASVTGLCRRPPTGRSSEGGRRGLHLGVAEALVELHRDSPAEVYGLLGHHFAEADDAERAVEYLLKAGDAARAVYAEDEAIDLYRRALGFMERTGDDARARQTLLKHRAHAPPRLRLRGGQRRVRRGVRQTGRGAIAHGADRAHHLGGRGGGGRRGRAWCSPTARRPGTSARICSAGCSRSPATSTSSPIWPSASASRTTGARIGSRSARTPAGATAGRSPPTTSRSRTRGSPRKHLPRRRRCSRA